MKKTELDSDFMAHKERCQDKIYTEIQILSHQEQIQYYHELVEQSRLGQWLRSIPRTNIQS